MPPLQDPQTLPTRSSEDGNVLAGPVFLQLDAGPDRTTDCSVEFRQSMWDRGLILFPGLPNGTAANQVMDDLFGTYKTGCEERAQDIAVSERIDEHELDPSVKVQLDFCELGRIIDGRPTDTSNQRPQAAISGHLGWIPRRDHVGAR